MLELAIANGEPLDDEQVLAARAAEAAPQGRQRQSAAGGSKAREKVNMLTAEWL
eukprot:CAMPEP_0196734480 /NCGR_PEP_ID=MMETSP1091-20130531/13211_1 /TAXON_ID=302021 /ORGANISM="Rhodomonas sp., Strain CCMP768" /LENGTH=53 /DNA_ID=CAMNT_0042077995 /DNA_START=65 /DNA_END=221 /DNA_ORIENTATION=-